MSGGRPVSKNVVDDDRVPAGERGAGAAPAWRYLFDMGLGEAASRRWIDESIALASRPRGTAGRGAAEHPLLVAVYRELESIERTHRAELLRGVASRLSRTVVATLGAAALDLLAPLAPNARDVLQERFGRERGRRVSHRLFEESEPRGAAWTELDSVEVPSSPASVAGAFAGLAAALEPGVESELVRAEVALAFQGGDTARPIFDDLRAVADDTVDPGVALDRIERGRAAAAFATGDDTTVLDTLERGALALDRSASAGAMRAASRHRSRPAALPSTGAPVPGDEFRGAVPPAERRRIARFLSFVHVAPATTRPESSEGATP